MPLTLYADECVDHRLVTGLRRRAVDVLTAGDADLLGASNEQQLRRATEMARVVLTGDHDFLRLTQAPSVAFPGLNGEAKKRNPNLVLIPNLILNLILILFLFLFLNLFLILILVLVLNLFLNHLESIDSFEPWSPGARGARLEECTLSRRDHRH